MCGGGGGGGGGVCVCGVCVCRYMGVCMREKEISKYMFLEQLYILLFVKHELILY